MKLGCLQIWVELMKVDDEMIMIRVSSLITCSCNTKMGLVCFMNVWNVYKLVGKSLKLYGRKDRFHLTDPMCWGAFFCMLGVSYTVYWSNILDLSHWDSFEGCWGSSHSALGCSRNLVFGF